MLRESIAEKYPYDRSEKFREGKIKVLDLFCGAGGAAMGLHLAFPEANITGIDIVLQPNYPFDFIQADALTYSLEGYDLIWASPPCQRYTRLNNGLNQSLGRAVNHPDYISPIRKKLIDTGKIYIIENVPGAPLINPVMLCGSMFGLDVQRHRLFESNVLFLQPQCNHSIWKKDKPCLHRLKGMSRVIGVYGNGRGKGDIVAVWRKAMGIDWMTRKELAQAVPPAFSKFLGEQLR